MEFIVILYDSIAGYFIFNYLQSFKSLTRSEEKNKNH